PIPGGHTRRVAIVASAGRQAGDWTGGSAAAKDSGLVDGDTGGNPARGRWSRDPPFTEGEGIGQAVGNAREPMQAPRKPGSPVGVEQPNIKRPAGRGLTPPTGPISVAKVVTAASDRSPIIDSKAIGRAKKRRDA